MKSALPRWFIAATVGASAAWAAFDFPQGERHQPGRSATSLTTAAKELDLVERLRRDPPSAQGGELFAAHDGAPARARAVSPAPAAQPAAPPFPFRFAGHLKEGGAVTHYLARGDEILPVRAGDLLEGFRIEALHEDRIEVTFVAGGQRLSVPWPAPAGATEDTPAPIRFAAAPALASGPVPLWPAVAGVPGASP